MKISIAAYTVLLASSYYRTATAQLRLLRNDRRDQIRQARAEPKHDHKEDTHGKGEPEAKIVPVEEPSFVAEPVDGSSTSMSLPVSQSMRVEDKQSMSMSTPSVDIAAPELEGMENEFGFGLVAAAEFSLSMSTSMSVNVAVPMFEEWKDELGFGTVIDEISLSMSINLKQPEVSDLMSLPTSALTEDQTESISTNIPTVRPTMKKESKADKKKVDLSQASFEIEIEFGRVSLSSLSMQEVELSMTGTLSTESFLTTNAPTKAPKASKDAPSPFEAIVTSSPVVSLNQLAFDGEQQDQPADEIVSTSPQSKTGKRHARALRAL
ncbi:predicted protein [Thalassiosira pseudonana CCMP1335]|uniref:Uncharacterized protein n=1 Tax=Thalassiosira pseudonana TaxID=35128 RepID=B8BT73_THAPS|nr:predicted protein [Thalassiosira pseudonana CCMP1335]EED95668.1 predicted protein [Thalassiosira pseudonana CCMP1335]